MKIISAKIILLSSVFLLGCADGGDVGVEMGINDVCSGQVELILGDNHHSSMLPLNLTANTSHPWGEGGGYTIRVGGGNYDYKLSTTGVDSVECEQIYDYFNPVTRLHTGEQRLYNKGEFFFRINPQFYHEVNPEFAQMSALPIADKLDENVNLALNQNFDAGALGNLLMFVGIDPTDTSDSPLGGKTVPTLENKNISGSFSNITLNCDENFTVQPVLALAALTTGFDLNPNYCGFRKSINDPEDPNMYEYCIRLKVNPPSEGAVCSFATEIAVKTQEPESLVPPKVGGDTISAKLEGSLERLVNTTNNNDAAAFHRWKLRINKLEIIDQQL